MSKELLESCKELRVALSLAMQAIYQNGLADEYLANCARHGIAPGIGVRAAKAIDDAPCVTPDGDER